MIIELHEKQDLERLLEQSQKEPVLIFKHSTQCSRSDSVFDEFEAFESRNGGVPCGLVLVIEDRKISNEVEERFGILHESPQAIIVVKGKPVWHASHWKITEDALDAALGAVHA